MPQLTWAGLRLGSAQAARAYLGEVEVWSPESDTPVEFRAKYRPVYRPTYEAPTAAPSEDVTAPTAPTGLAAAVFTATSVTLTWNASTDAVGVTGYEVFRGGVLLTTTTSRSFTVTGLTPATAYTFTVQARDAAGNRSAVATVTRTTATAPDTAGPTVAVTAPAAGATVTGTATVSGTVTDPSGVAGVQVRANGVTLGNATVGSGTWTYAWDTTGRENGSVSLTARATDTAGNATISTGRSVTVTNATAPPPPPGGNDPLGAWDTGYVGPIPADAVTFSGTTGAALRTAILALPAGKWLKVTSTTITGSMQISSGLKDNIVICNAPGVRPTILNGLVTMEGGFGWRWLGIDIRYPSPPASSHIAKFDGGSRWEVAYCRVYETQCFTLARVGRGATNWRCHHMRVDDNLPANGTNQDHCFYVDPEVIAQNGRIDHCIISDSPNGRGVKIGGPSSGGAIGGVRVDHNTIHHCTGPSAVQVSNGATNCVIENNVVWACGPTSFTDGPGSLGGNLYRNNATDVPADNTANLRDAGGNVIRTLAQLQDATLMASQGYGHLA